LNSIRLLPNARNDVVDAARWYEHRRAGLGIEFLLELDAALERAGTTPLAYRVRLEGLRRVALRRFPYSVYFRVLEDGIEIHAVLHHRRAP